MNQEDSSGRAPMRWKLTLAKWTFIASIFALSTFYHEVLHGLAALFSGGVWSGLTLNFYDWHYYFAKPFQLLTLGFIEIQKIPVPDGPYTAGFARIAGDRFSMLISAAAPNFAFAYVGAYQLLTWLPSRWDERRPNVQEFIEKALASAVGAYLIYQPYQYGRITMSSRELAAGNDFGLIMYYLGLASDHPAPWQGTIGWLLCVGAALLAAYATHRLVSLANARRQRRAARRAAAAAPA